MSWEEQYERGGRELIRLFKALRDGKDPAYAQLAAAGMFRDLLRDPIVTTGPVWDYRVRSLANLTLGYLKLHKLSHAQLETAAGSVFQAVDSFLLEEEYFRLQDQLDVSCYVAAALAPNLAATLEGGSLALLAEMLRFPECQAHQAIRAHGVEPSLVDPRAVPRPQHEPHLYALIARSWTEPTGCPVCTGELLRQMLADPLTGAGRLLRELGLEERHFLDLEPEGQETEKCRLLEAVESAPSADLSTPWEVENFSSRRHPAAGRETQLSEMDKHILAGWDLYFSIRRSSNQDLKTICDSWLGHAILRDDLQDEAWAHCPYKYRFLKLAKQVKPGESSQRVATEKKVDQVMARWLNATFLSGLTRTLRQHLRRAKGLDSLALLGTFLSDPRCSAYEALSEQGVSIAMLGSARNSGAADSQDHLELFDGVAHLAATVDRWHQQEASTAHFVLSMLESANENRAGQVLRKLKIDPEKLRIHAAKWHSEL